MIYILLEFEGGKVGIMSMVTNDTALTNLKVNAEVAKLPQKVLRWQQIDARNIPSSRRFREAWAFSDAGIVVNLPRAKQAYREELRVRRAPILASLDVAYQRADEANDALEKHRIANSKQWLRDITKDARIDNAATVEELDGLVVLGPSDGLASWGPDSSLVSSTGGGR